MGSKMGKICPEAHVFLETRTIYFQPCPDSRRQPRMHPVSGPAMQEIIYQLIADVNELKENLRVSHEELIARRILREVIREVIDQVVEHLKVQLIRVGVLYGQGNA